MPAAASETSGQPCPSLGPTRGALTGPWAPPFPGQAGCPAARRCLRVPGAGCGRGVQGSWSVGSRLKGSLLLQLPEPKARVHGNHRGPRALPAGPPRSSRALEGCWPQRVNPQATPGTGSPPPGRGDGAGAGFGSAGLWLGQVVCKGPKLTAPPAPPARTGAGISANPQASITKANTQVSQRPAPARPCQEQPVLPQPTYATVWLSTGTSQLPANPGGHVTGAAGTSPPCMGLRARRAGVESGPSLGGQPLPPSKVGVIGHLREMLREGATSPLKGPGTGLGPRRGGFSSRFCHRLPWGSSGTSPALSSPTVRPGEPPYLPQLLRRSFWGRSHLLPRLWAVPGSRTPRGGPLCQAPKRPRNRQARAQGLWGRVPGDWRPRLGNSSPALLPPPGTPGLGPHPAGWVNPSISKGRPGYK